MTTTRPEADQKEPTWHWWLLVLVPLVWVAYWFVSIQYFGEVNISDKGAFGDMFGGLNALFSGLAFGGLIIAILLQRRQLKLQVDELALQRKELELTRKELKGQKQQLEQQNRTLSRQNFENTFFQLLSLYNELVTSLKTGSATTGRDCFMTFCNLYFRAVQESIKGGQRMTDKSLGEIYSIQFAGFPKEVSNCFRLLYNILKFVDRSSMSDGKVYTNLVRALLTEDELLLIFYNCYSEQGKKLKPLLERYSMLKHLNRKRLLDESHAAFYHHNAYTRSVPLE